MYIYITERNNGAIICHASNNLTYINKYKNKWRIDSKGNEHNYYIKEFKCKLDNKFPNYILIYKDKTKSDQYIPIAISFYPSVLRNIGKKKKGDVPMKDYKYQSFRVVQITDSNTYEAFEEEVEEPEKRVFTRKTQADGSIQLWYNNELIATCDNESEVREVLEEENATL